MKVKWVRTPVVGMIQRIVRLGCKVRDIEHLFAKKFQIIDFEGVARLEGLVFMHRRNFSTLLKSVSHFSLERKSVCLIVQYLDHEIFNCRDIIFVIHFISCRNRFPMCLTDFWLVWLHTKKAVA